MTLFEKEYRHFFFVTNDDSIPSEEVVLFYEKEVTAKITLMNQIQYECWQPYTSFLLG
jgi:hypothetical protein